MAFADQHQVKPFSIVPQEAGRLQQSQVTFLRAQMRHGSNDWLGTVPGKARGFEAVDPVKVHPLVDHFDEPLSDPCSQQGLPDTDRDREDSIETEVVLRGAQPRTKREVDAPGADRDRNPGQAGRQTAGQDRLGSIEVNDVEPADSEVAMKTKRCEETEFRPLEEGNDRHAVAGGPLPQGGSRRSREPNVVTHRPHPGHQAEQLLLPSAPNILGIDIEDSQRVPRFAARALTRGRGRHAGSSRGKRGLQFSPSPRAWRV